MDKQRIADRVASNTGLDSITARTMVNATLDAIVDEILETDRVELWNFGAFQVRLQGPRAGRNPRTGERIDIPPRYALRFKPSVDHKNRVDYQFQQRAKQRQNQKKSASGEV